MRWGVPERCHLILGRQPNDLVVFRESNQKGALLLVHGYSGNFLKTWKYILRLLPECSSLDQWDIFTFGYPTSLMPDINGIWSSKPNIDTLAKKLVTTINSEELGRYDKISLFAHSMGGLIVQRAIINCENTQERLKKLALICTPSNGTRKARAFGINNQAQDMIPDSKFIVSLREEWGEKFGKMVPFDMLVAHGESDQFILQESSFAPFDSKYHAVLAGNHTSVLKPRRKSFSTMNEIQKLMNK